MKKFFDKGWVLTALRLVIGGLFIYAGATKIQGPQAFADSIATFQVLPHSTINLLALGLPPFEMMTGFLLVVGWQKRAAAFSILVLSAVFALALGQALARGLNVDCGCFGSGRPSIWKTWAALSRDLFFGAGAWRLYRQACRDMERSG